MSVIRPEEVYLRPLTPLDFLVRSAAVFPDRTAVVYGERRSTYRQFAERVNRLAHALRGAGVARGDRVAVLCPNLPPTLEAHYGVPLAGGALVAINTRLAPAEVAYILRHSEAKVLVADAEFAPLLAAIAGEIPSVATLVIARDDQASLPADAQQAAPRLVAVDYEAFLSGASAEPLAPVLESENDMISINYTSGTTGRPKGVVYTHRGACLNALGEVVEAGLTSRSVYLWTLPMFHCNGWCFPWAVTAVGGRHVCLRRVDPAEVHRLIDAEGVTHMCGAPTVLIGLANHPSAAGRRFERPLRIVTAGAPPSPVIIRTMEAMGADVTHVYGLTETYGPHTVCEWHAEWDALPTGERARKKARQGVPYVHAAGGLRVVDPQMRDVPADGETMGEVVMSGNNVMAGYYRQPEATAEAFRGGWFHSGDIAVTHPDGYIELKDRAKDIIISGGENISTVEVERVIYEHPDVLEVAVIAVPDEKWGEVPKAFVVPRPGHQPTAESIIAFCRERLAHFKCPKAVEFGELPKTATGKIQKFALRESEWKGREKRIN